MTLRTSLRGFRATTIVLAACALALAPLATAAEAKTPAKTAASKKAKKKATKRAALRETHSKKGLTGSLRAVGTPQTLAKTAPAANGLTKSMELGPTTQLAAMKTAISASAEFFAGRDTNCALVTPLLAAQGGAILAGNFRDTGGNCYVWLNIEHSDLLSGEEICKTTLHEMGHLAGLQHVADVTDVMYAPFQTDPTPEVCKAKPAGSAATAAKASAVGVRVCPPGATNVDYCATAPKAKRKVKRGAKRRIARVAI